MHQPAQPQYDLALALHALQDSDISKVLTEVASHAELSTNMQLQFPALDSNDMYIDSERHKHKTIHQGVYSSQAPFTSHTTTGGGVVGGKGSQNGAGVSTLIKLTISQVQRAGSGRISHEMSGTSPQLNELLLAMLRTGGTDAEQEQELLAHVHNMILFAKQLVSSCSVSSC